MVFIYILELENKKYYVGKTINPDFRLEQHFNSYGAQWTKKFKPKKVLEIIPNCDNFDEDKFTLKYMEKYGINNVRGGTFCEIKLNKDIVSTITKMINGSTNKCYNCGNNSHFVKDCTFNINNDKDEDKYNICDCITLILSLFNNNISEHDNNHNDNEETNKLLDDNGNLYCKRTNNKTKNICYKCGRKGHNINDCYASKHINGKYLIQK